MLAKKLIGPFLTLVAVVGIGGVALAGALPGAADPGPASAGSAAPDRLPALRACVDAKVAAGGTRAEGRRACVTEARAARHAGRRLGLEGATHAEVTVPVAGGDGYEVVQVDRGTVAAADGGSVTVARADGPGVTLRLTGTTVWKGAASGPADLVVGRRVAVVSRDGVARTVAERKA